MADPRPWWQTYNLNQSYGPQQIAPPSSATPFSGASQWVGNRVLSTATLPPPQRTPAARPGVVWGQAGQNIYGAQQGLLSAQQNQINAQGGVFGAQQNQINAQNGVFGAQQNQIGAQRAYYATRAGALSASNAYLTEQQRGAIASAQEAQRIANAQGNTADITAVGQQQALLSATDRRRGELGLSAATRVTLPPGVSQAALPPGVVAAPQTMEQQERRAADTASSLREGPLSMARIAAAQAGNLSEESQLAASQAGLSVDEARLAESRAGAGVDQSRLDESRIGTGVDQARLNLSASQLGPGGGMVYDETTGNFVTREQAAVNQQNNTATVYDPVNNEYVPRSQAPTVLMNGRRQLGNIVNRDTGELTDPNNGNVYRNGAWTDPNTGNVFDPNGQTWTDPQSGNVFHIVNQRTGSGYWTNRAGYYMSSDGIWRDPVTGQAVYSVTGQAIPRRGAATATPLFPPASGGGGGSAPAVTPPSGQGSDYSWLNP